MRIPSARIAEYLTPNFPVPVLTSSYGCFNSCMPYTHAIALAERGEVEAIASRGGKVRYLRLLAENERPLRLVVEEIPEEAMKGRPGSSAIAATNLGVYREAVESKQMDEFGLPTRIVIGHIWSHCGLRRKGL